MIPEAEREQNALDDEYNRLQRYRPNENSRYFQIREDVLNNVGHLRDGRRLLIDAFRNKIFPLRVLAFYPQYHNESSESSESSSDSDGNNEGNNGNNGGNN